MGRTRKSSSLPCAPRHTFELMAIVRSYDRVSRAHRLLLLLITRTFSRLYMYEYS